MMHCTCARNNHTTAEHCKMFLNVPFCNLCSHKHAFACMGTCVLPELCSQGGHLFLLTSSVCIITRLPELGSRCYESARVTNDHGIALGTHTHTHAGCKPAFQIPKRDVGCLCLSVIHWVSTLCLARFSLGGTDSIHSPDNRLVIHSRDWEKLSSQQGRVRKSK